MIQNANLYKINMNPSNNNNNNIGYSNWDKKNDVLKTFRHINPTINKLPSISYMLIPQQKDNQKNNKKETVIETKLVETAGTKETNRLAKENLFHSSSPLSTIAIESTNQPVNYEFRIPASHQRTSSLDSLMNAAENLEHVDHNLQSKIPNLQRIKSMFLENINVLERKYCGNINQNLTTIREEEIFETLRNLQKLSLELHELILDILEPQRGELVATSQSISNPSLSPAEKNSLSTIDLPQPRMTLLPPLILNENSQTIPRMTGFKFPYIKSHFLTPNGNNANLQKKVIVEEEPYNAPLEQNLQYKPLVFNKTNHLLQTPKREEYSNITPNYETPTAQSNLVVTNPFNKSGNSFTLFPQNNNGKSTIITPVSQGKNHISQKNKGTANTVFIPPLNHEPQTVKVTPKTSREEDIIFSDLMQVENEPKMDIPYNVKRIKTGSTTKNLTSRKGAPIGITTTLKLTNKSLMEKSIKKYKQKEEFEHNETYLPTRESVTIGKHFENKGPIMQIQDMGKIESKKKSREKDKGEEGVEEVNKKCFHCQSSKTPEWRAGPYGGENICNACGLFYRKIVSKFGEKGGNLLMKYRQLVCPTNRRVPPYIEIPEEYMIRFSKESGFNQFSS